VCVCVCVDCFKYFIIRLHAIKQIIIVVVVVVKSKYNCERNKA